MGPPSGVLGAGYRICRHHRDVVGPTPWILAVGDIIWLAAAAVTLTEVFRSRHELSEPRPGLWKMRFMLINDTVHALSAVQPS